MKTINPLLKAFALIASALIGCTLNLHAQSPPTMTTQPSSQTNLVGTGVNFTVTAGGTGPFTYHWQFNGTNLPSIITTVAGNGTGTYAGDGGAATNASLNTPFSVAFDASGGLYIADTINNRVRKVDTSGVITTVAGNGSGAHAGDGGAATNASLYYPEGVAFDASDNLYIADAIDDCVRLVNASGTISTVAGQNFGFSGDGGAATNASLYRSVGVTIAVSGDLYIADEANNRIRRVDTNGIITTVAGNGAETYAGDGGAATNASLNNPSGVAFDPMGNLYIADRDNNRIRRVDPNGVITTVAGNGIGTYAGDGGAATNASLNWPSGLTADGSGNLYIGDYYNNRIRMVNTNGIIITVAGNGISSYSGDGGMAPNAGLDLPNGVALDAYGNLYFADSGNNLIREIHFAGYPAFSLTNVNVTNAGNYSVVITSAGGSITSSVAVLTVAAPAVITAQPAGQFAAVGTSPSFSVAVAGSGPFEYLWYVGGTNVVQSGTNCTLTFLDVSTNDTGDYTVVVTNNYGSVTSQVATLTVGFPPSVTSQPDSQTNLAGTTVNFSVTPGGTGPFTYHWQFDGTNLPCGIITTMAGNGSSGFSGDGGAATNAHLYYPEGLGFDAFGNLYIADSENSRIRVVTANGVINTVAGNGQSVLQDGGAATNTSLDYPTSVAFDAFGNLYIADEFHNRIRKISPNGIIATVAGTNGLGYDGDGGAATDAHLYYPCGLVSDGFGNLYIGDTDNSCIRMVNTNGIITTFAGNGISGYSGDGGMATNAYLNYPFGVTLDTAGNLYIADTDNHCIRMVDGNGIIHTVAGGGGPGLGDGGAATNASLYYPSGVAFDAIGNLYIADSGHDRIRMMNTNGVITTVAGIGGQSYSGDGGAATNAGLSGPMGVAFDAFGNLYVADDVNCRIREVLLYSGYPTLILGSIRATNAGNYSVVVTSPYGSVTSAVVRLTVLLPPTISTQPASQFAGAGSSPSFSVAATGNSPLEYSWFFDATNLLQSGTNYTLTLPDVATNNTGDYIVVVTNAYGSATSQVAILSVAFPPTVMTQPHSQTNLAGATASFSVTAGGIGPFSYQWQFNGTNLPDIITTVAGDAANGYSGDGGAATSASLNSPSGVAFGPGGNLYIADTDNDRIRMVDANGIIHTVAGKTGSGFSGDGGAATNALLNWPWGVTSDALGNLFIADTENGRIRMVNRDGIIQTVAGKSGSGYSGDGKAATNALLNWPLGVALDAPGNLFIADTSNNRIRKVATNGIITTVAGKNGAGFTGDGGAATNACLNHPTGVTVDACGNLLVADTSNNRIRKVATNGIITTVAGGGGDGYGGDGGAATNASLNQPSGTALDAAGNMYIGDTGNERVRMVAADGSITTVAGNGDRFFYGDGGAATNATLYSPIGVAVDAAGNLFIAAAGDQRIREVRSSTVLPTLVLPAVTGANDGSYAVVITSPFGSVTSAVVSLTVTIPGTPPLISTGDGGFGLRTNEFGFKLSGAAGQTIVVDGSTNLVSWTPLLTNLANGSPFYFFDPAWTNFPWRFYRARLP